MKPWQYWLAFVVCLGVVLAAMGWVSFTAIRLDRSQILVAQEADFEEDVRLALWRMDSALAPILARESSRPYFVYSPFYPAERAYTKMFEQIESREVMVPSPLLREVTPRVLLHFQIDPEGNWISPQVPHGRMKKLSVEAYANGVIIAESETKLAGLRKGLLMEQVTREALLEAIPENTDDGQPSEPFLLVRESEGQQANVPLQRGQAQSVKSINEWNVRYEQQQVARNKGNKLGKASSSSRKVSQQERPQAVNASPSDVTEGVMHPLWIGEMLLLARRVTVNGGDYVQGCWLDWPEIRRELLAQIDDLLSDADLKPVLDEAERGGGRRLAGLPVRLMPGEMPRPSSYGLTPVRLSLYIAWACVLLAAAAVGILLVGAVSLSERRGAFVSAVTHELRTPLTTFRIYSEMLAEGMVTDGGKRKEYLNTLCAEGNRLSHLVENVLSYARLERGHGRGQMETVRLGDMIDRMKDRLSRRAEQCGMMLSVDGEEDMRCVNVKTDVSAVEQILFNLVDNACKYAHGVQDKRIHIGARLSDRRVVISVRDHGPGIAEEESGRLFRPFCKSAKHAAESAPGVGLGLALSRRMARQMGGDLRIDTVVDHGASFELSIHAADSREAEEE
jgi:signal transduction histidine kinase